MKYISLPVKLTCWFSAVFLVGFVIFGVVMWLDLSYSLSKGRDRTLSRRAIRLQELLHHSPDVATPASRAKFAEFAEAMPEGNLIHLFERDGRTAFGEVLAPADFPWPPLSVSAYDSYTEVSYSGRPFRVLSRPVTVTGTPMIIRVAGQLEDNRNLLGRFVIGLEAATPVLLVISALCGYFLSRRALTPVDRLTSAVRSITARNLSGRLPVKPTGDELQRLAETCNDMLARLEDTVGRTKQFTADASHELRGPISFIRTITEFALRQPGLNAETKETFEDILAESIEAGILLEDMLTLARADAGRLEVVLQPLNLTELVEEVCSKVRPLAEKKSQLLEVTSEDRVMGIQGDRPTLRRLLWTLLDNAVKYTPEHGHIEVSLEPTSAGAKFVVWNSGIGIPTEALPRVFDRFFRADPSRSQADGTGLGLAIAKWIADAHNARLLAESKQGEGTTFSVIFALET